MVRIEHKKKNCPKNKEKGSISPLFRSDLSHNQISLRRNPQVVNRGDALVGQYEYLASYVTIITNQSWWFAQIAQYDLQCACCGKYFWWVGGEMN